MVFTSLGSRGHKRVNEVGHLLLPLSGTECGVPGVRQAWPLLEKKSLTILGYVASFCFLIFICVCVFGVCVCTQYVPSTCH